MPGWKYEVATMVTAPSPIFSRREIDKEDKRNLFNIMAASKKAKETSVDISDIISELAASRKAASKSVAEYQFNMDRVRCVSGDPASLRGECKALAYWMNRDHRIQDNWAMLYAQKLAMENNLPLHVVCCVRLLSKKCPEATFRRYDFMLKGLKEVQADCKELHIGFHLLLLKDPAHGIADWIKEMQIGCLVTDFSPLKADLDHLQKLQSLLLTSIHPDCCVYQVDGHNVVPCWIASNKQEYGARTIRSKITSKLTDFLVEFPPVVKHCLPTKGPSINWKELPSQIVMDLDVEPIDWAQPGTRGGLAMLKSFVNKRLKLYHDKRNDPTVNALSNLSPWFHFGHLSPARAVMYVKKHSRAEGVKDFVEESVVRRELADNFCFYNAKYDKLQGAANWAIRSLDLHRGDPREYVYSMKQLESAKTHDDLWNSAQLQLVREGKMHGFLRMYWAKKILEWTEQPEKALHFAMTLNDKYSIDGCDPSGYVGCMWSICGIHDRGWAERKVFGKIRYMNYAGCKRKFAVDAFVARYGGKNHDL